MQIFDISLSETLAHLVRLVIAYLLALPVAWNRERDARGAGLRTFPLVAMASCGFMITGLYVLDSTDAESRVIYGIITGIGFIGGGAILKEHGTIEGTSSAASIWNTGAIGVAVAFDRLEIAIPLALLNVLTLRLGAYVKRKVPHRDEE